MRPLVLGAALLVLPLDIAQAAPVITNAVEPSAGCLSYSDPSVALTGTAFSRIYFGPPGYGESPAQDAREPALLLLLDAPVCVKASAHPELDNNSVETNVILVQLAAVHVSSEVLWKAAGRRISVKGSLYHALTGHHRTPVLMDVYAVETKVP
jgi:Domain of unknown function (DUF4431)